MEFALRLFVQNCRAGPTVTETVGGRALAKMDWFHGGVLKYTHTLYVLGRALIWVHRGRAYSFLCISLHRHSKGQLTLDAEATAVAQTR